METIKAIFKNAWPYQKDKMNLPVKELEASIPFYETVMGFNIISTKSEPYKTVILGRDEIEIGLSENGGDPSQEGCFFAVDDVEAAFAELKSRGLNKEDAGYRITPKLRTKFPDLFLREPRQDSH